MDGFNAYPQPITLLMRDGSHVAVDLADSWRQAGDLAAALAPRGGAATTVTLDLADGSTLMLSVADILGLRLPPELRAAPLPAVPPPPQDAEIHRMGAWRVMRICNFLPPAVAADLYRYAVARQSEFKPSKVLSNDPEYRKSVILFRFPDYETMFHAALRSAFPPICEALNMPAFDLADIECQLTATFNRGYFKPHNDNAAALGHRRITYVYYFHREPRPFVGGDVRFFDHNPFAADAPPVRHSLDIAPVHNSVVFFDSSCYHEVRDVVCRDEFENARFTINGWLSRARAMPPAQNP